MPRLVDQRRHVQQCLRRDASAVQAHAAWVLFPIDERDPHSEIRRKKCRCVTTRSAADYCDVEICVFSHGILRPRRTLRNTKEFLSRSILRVTSCPSWLKTCAWLFANFHPFNQTAGN